MSGSSNSFEDAERNAKKRRIYLIEDDVVVTESDIHLKQRLDSASKFGREIKIEDSEWFKNRGVRLSSLDVKKRITILIPVDVPNVEEATDELWI